MSKINQLESLRVVKAVVEEGSFTAAGKRLNLSAARISKSIERLEAELKTTLFIRSTRHIQLTESGERCYRHALTLLDNWRGMCDELGDNQTNAKGQLKISVPMTWGLHVFSPLLAKFMDKYPQITVDAHLSDSYVNVIEGEYDLVLRLANKLEDSALLCKKLRTYQFITCASPKYLEQNGRPMSPEDLRSHRCLVFSQQGQRRNWQFNQNGKVINVYPEPYLQSNNSALFIQALLSHQGIALIPEFVVESDINQGKLLQLLTDYVTHDLSLYLLRPADHMAPKRLQLFVDFLHQELAV